MIFERPWIYGRSGLSGGVAEGGGEEHRGVRSLNRAGPRHRYTRSAQPALSPVRCRKVVLSPNNTSTRSTPDVVPQRGKLLAPVASTSSIYSNIVLSSTIFNLHRWHLHRQIMISTSSLNRMFRNLGEARPPTSTSTSQSIITALDMRQHKWDKKRFRLRDIQVCIPAATGEVSILTQKE